MTRASIDHRASLISIGNDQFFSAPSSRASTPVILEPSSLTRAHLGVSSEPVTPFLIDSTLKQRWTLPFTRHQHPEEPAYLSLFPKSLSGHLQQSQPGTGADSPLFRVLYELANPNNTPNTATLNMTPSPRSQRSVVQQSPTGFADLTVPSLRLRRSPALDDLRVPYRSSHASVESIICNIRAFLSHRRHTGCSQLPNAPVPSSENRSPVKTPPGKEVEGAEQSADTYLITTNDIASILEIVTMGLQGIHGEKSPAGFLSRLLPRGNTDRPSMGSRAIMPRMSTHADPATTFSSVQPTFSSTGAALGHERKINERGVPTVTYISRQSVTEVD